MAKTTVVWDTSLTQYNYVWYLQLAGAEVESAGTYVVNTALMLRVIICNKSTLLYFGCAQSKVGRLDQRTRIRISIPTSLCIRDFIPNRSLV